MLIRDRIKELRRVPASRLISHSEVLEVAPGVAFHNVADGAPRHVEVSAQPLVSDPLAVELANRDHILRRQSSLAVLFTYRDKRIPEIGGARKIF